MSGSFSGATATVCLAARNVGFQETACAPSMTEMRRTAAVHVAAEADPVWGPEAEVRFSVDRRRSALHDGVQDGLHVLFQVEFAPCLNGQ
ncbi:hypothetical protein [Mesorhizobium sophorae]|uniref:hypothetical protein n=1 Tax=Mesorhizobium sophorae TaxID=1300294 RepID=UPI00117E2EC5|nr:hypothetical protein [Mesorhizobium sophorae]